jgi:hypothetical protein
VVTPYENEGLRSIDFRYWTAKPQGRVETVWPEVGVGLGVSSRWTTELFMSWKGSSRLATKPSTLNWQNEFMLTQGKLPLGEKAVFTLQAALLTGKTCGREGRLFSLRAHCDF